MKYSNDALTILSLLDTHAFSKRIGIIHWDSLVEAITTLHAICHRADTSAKDIARQVQCLKDSMPEQLFFELIGRDEELQIIKATLPSGQKFIKRFAEDWEDLCSSPSSMNDAQYPSKSWPVWCNGKETVFVTEDCKVQIQDHISKQ
ncbi:hypothetical protein N9Z08_04355 [Pirellulales bacterium]|nr:hypothetical protein [Pirellulales bacterium]